MTPEPRLQVVSAKRLEVAPDLGTAVAAMIDGGRKFIEGVVVGRTLEQHPRVDIRLANGRLIPNVPVSDLVTP